MMVFAAYFVTILAFAGLYLTVNEVGRAYGGGHGAGGLELGGTGGGGALGGSPASVESEVVGPGSTSRLLSAGTSDGEVPPEFCGMDINNHMEGESARSL